VLKGSQFVAQERIIKDKKLRRGPGIKGKMQPIIPDKAKSKPRIINAIANIDLLLD
jgi:hypothetical protein